MVMMMVLIMITMKKIMMSRLSQGTITGLSGFESYDKGDDAQTTRRRRADDAQTPIIFDFK